MKNDTINYLGGMLLFVGIMILPAGASAADEGFALEEITVTARKREENLQDTPISISAFTAGELELRQIHSVDQLTDVTPNLIFEGSAPSSGASSSAQIFIRGIGQTDFAPVTDPGVGLYIDGVYLARSGGAVIDFLDIERVEILRGPQGTLFGKNTIGGAVVVHSKKPDDELGGSIKGEIGSDSKNFWTAKANVPVSDTLKSSFALSSRNRDGYVIREVDGIDLGDDDTLGGRVAVLWTPTDTFEAFLAVDYTSTRENGTPASSGGNNDQSLFPRVANFLEPSCGGAFPFPPSAPIPSTGSNTNCANLTQNRGPFRNAGSFPVYSNGDAWGGSVTLEWGLTDSLTVKSISSYRSLETESSRDPDQSSLLVFHSVDILDQDQFSQELQLNGDSLDGRLNWLLGAYYFQEEAVNSNPVGIVTGDLHSGGSTDNDSSAIFAQATYDATDQLSLTLGVRQTDDTKRFTPNSFYSSSNPILVAAGLTPPGTALTPIGPVAIPFFVLPVQEFSRKFDDTNYLANISYRWNDDFMAYISYSTGFKSGGFDQRFIGPPIDLMGNLTNAPSTFRPESADTVELGFKSDLLDHVLRLNVAVFSTDYEDLHVIVNETFNPITLNAGVADIKGFEIEGTFVPNENLWLTVNVGYLDAEYSRLDPSVLAFTPITLANKLVNVPEWTFNVGAAYRIPLQSGAVLTPRLDWSFHDEQENNAINSLALHQDSYHLLNVALVFESSDGRWVGTLSGRNVLDETFVITGTGSFNAGTGFQEVVYGRPSEWGLSLEYHFF